MNPTIELMQRHRSIRRYAEESIPTDHIRQAVEAGQAASTSSAVQSYCLIRVTDDACRERLIELTGGQPKVASSGAFFAVCGDVRRHRILCERAGLPYRAHLEAFLLAVIDATLFAQNLALAFESMNYGVCYIGGLRNSLPEVDELLALPPGVYPLYGLCVGVPAEQPAARPRLPFDAVYFEDEYPSDERMGALLDSYDETYEAYLRERGVAAPQERVWSKVMARKFSELQREGLAAYYASKGADFG